MQLSVNGRAIKQPVGGQTTFSATPRDQRWFSGEVIHLAAGSNTLRLTAAWSMPQLDKLALVPLSTSGKAKLPRRLATRGIEAGPWDFSGKPRPFSEICFEDFRDSKGELTQDEARSWFEHVEGRSLVFYQTTNQYGQAVHLKGTAKLRAPWPADAVLRMSIYSGTVFKLHFWNGHEGVTLVHYNIGGTESWAAYRVSRAPGSKLTIGDQLYELPDPALALLATDEGRNVRTPGGTFQFRHQDDLLMMTKGDVRILTVPLSAPPTDVTMEGESILLRDIAMFRGLAFPPQQQPQHKVVVSGDRPGALPWEEHLPEGARLERNDGASLELEAKETSEASWASLPMIRPGLYEVILRIDQAAAGSGVYFGSADGSPVEGISFAEDSHSGRLVLRFAKPSDSVALSAHDLNSAVIPFVGRHQWLKLVAGLGTLKCWTSGDGVHWSQMLAAVPRVSSSYGSLVLHHPPTKLLKTLRLAHLQIRELDALSTLASVELREAASRISFTSEQSTGDALGYWQQQVWENLPSGASLSDWREACVVSTLSAGCPTTLSKSLLDRLVQEWVDSSRPLDAKLRLLHDVGLIYDNQTRADSQQFARHYQWLTVAVVRQGGAESFDKVRRAIAEAPAWVPASDMKIILSDLGRDELMRLVDQGRWDQVELVYRRLKFLLSSIDLKPDWPASQKSVEQVVGWVMAQLTAARPELRELYQVVTKPEWKHPAVLRVGKEAYNTLAEVQVALKDKAYKDACQIIAANATGALGLLPDASDPRLMGSLPTVVRTATSDHPGLRDTMHEEYGPVGAVRVRRAIAEGDAAAVQDATVKYYGTQASAEANRWLGDRLLSSGRFELAIGHYRRARPFATVADQSLLNARIRMAGAMMGRLFGNPVTASVSVGETEMTAAEFEKLVTEMAALRRKQGSFGDVLGHRVSFQPSPLEVKPWAKLDGDMGTSPPTSHALDWAGRQTSAVIDADRLLVANRYQLVAYSLSNASIIWRFVIPRGEQGASTAWPMVPMRPYLAGKKIYLRFINKSNQPELFCLDRTTGKMLFRTAEAGPILSDPLLVQDQPYALSVERTSDNLVSHLKLLEIHPETGKVVKKSDLVELRSHWTSHQACQAVALGDQFIAAMAGTVVSCDTQGKVQWVRQCTWMPASFDRRGQKVYAQAPIVGDQRVYVLLTGVAGVQCMDRDSGRLLWTHSSLQPERMLGVVQGRLILQTAEGLAAVEVSNGRLTWRHPAEHLLDGYLLTADGQVVYARREAAKQQLWHPTLVWIDSDNGETLARQPLSALAHKQPTLGPLLAHESRLWCFSGGVSQAGKSDILELVTQEKRPSRSSLEPWIETPATGPLRVDQESVLPGWTLLSGLPDAKTGAQAELAGEKDVLVTAAGATLTRLVRFETVPQSGKSHLLMRMGALPGATSQLEVRVNGQTLIQVSPQPVTQAAQWQRHQVDLSKFAGQRVCITVLHDQADTGPAYIGWKQLEVVSP